MLTPSSRFKSIPTMSHMRLLNYILALLAVILVQSYNDAVFPVLGESFCSTNCRHELVEALQYSDASILVDIGGESICAWRLTVLQGAHVAFSTFHSGSRIEVLFYICLGDVVEDGAVLFFANVEER